MWKTAFKKFEGVWSALSRPYSLKFFKGYLPQSLLSSFLDTLTHISTYISYIINKKSYLEWVETGRDGSKVLFAIIISTQRKLFNYFQWKCLCLYIIFAWLIIFAIFNLWSIQGVIKKQQQKLGILRWEKRGEKKQKWLRWQNPVIKQYG